MALGEDPLPGEALGEEVGEGAKAPSMEPPAGAGAALLAADGDARGDDVGEGAKPPRMSLLEDRVKDSLLGEGGGRAGDAARGDEPPEKPIKSAPPEAPFFTLTLAARGGGLGDTVPLARGLPVLLAVNPRKPCLVGFREDARGGVDAARGGAARAGGEGGGERGAGGDAARGWVAWAAGGLA